VNEGRTKKEKKKSKKEGEGGVCEGAAFSSEPDSKDARPKREVKKETW